MAKKQTEEIGILKSIWRKNELGEWIIHDIQGIDLRPRDGFAKDFFKIEKAGGHRPGYKRIEDGNDNAD
jgi:hypothetical protein